MSNTRRDRPSSNLFSVNDSEIELGVLFGHRLVHAAPIKHKLFLALNNDELLNF